ncbi:MAG: hypothetical protein WC438_06010 [Candidatus Pacearchaeota archaeon]
MKQDSINSELKIVLQKMCETVGAVYKDIDFKKTDWFLDYEWTEEQEKNFKNWFVNRLIKNKYARKELIGCSKNKKICEKFVDMFIFNYGWKRK